MFTLTIQDTNGQVVNTLSFEQGSYILGRMEGCDIVLASTSVSRKHARISVHNGRCYLEDLGSANGVVVDGQRVVGRRDLGTASQIRIGDFYLFLEFRRAGLSDEQRVLQTVFIPRDSDHCKLVRIYDSFAGEEFILSESENTIGRTDENFILLSDPSISRYHAKIIREGDSYSVMDLGSSNGTSYNGKPLAGMTMLLPGDLVKFGNVEFVFVDGETQVDLRNYVKEPEAGSKFIRLAASAILVLCGIAIGASILFGLSGLKKEKTDEPKETTPVAKAADTLESKVAARMERGEKALENSDWDAAIAAFDEALELAPDNEEAKSSKASAVLEKSAAATLERGEELIEKGEHEEAKKILEEVPKETRAYTRAKSDLEHLNQTLAHNYKNEAIRLEKAGSKRSLKQAHEKFVQALELTPEDEDILKRTTKLEAKMKKKRVKFTPYEG